MIVDETIMYAFLKILQDTTGNKTLVWKSSVEFDEDTNDSPFSTLNEWYRFKFTEKIDVYLLCFPDRDQYTLYCYKPEKNDLSEIISSEKNEKIKLKLIQLYKIISTLSYGYKIDDELYGQIQILLDNFGVVTNFSKVIRGKLDNI